MSGPMNVVVGDQDFGTSLPQTDVPEEALTEEKKMAKYSKSKEFARLKEHVDGRIEYYKRYQPNGTSIIEMKDEERSLYWAVANIVIAEFQAILDSYEQAKEAVNDTNK